MTLLVLTGTASAQDPCALVTGTSDTIFSGRPPTVTLKMAASSTVDGFTLAVNGVTLPDFMAGAVPIPVTCADGAKGYTIRLGSGYPKGSHTLSVKAFNFQRDANGNPTTTKQESAVVSRPFVVVDEPIGPPPAPSNLRVWP